MFVTFLLQVGSRYILHAPFGWTLELCLILWLWIVFWGNAFVVRDSDHVTFDIFYNAAGSPMRRILALVAAAAIVIGMLWSVVPTWDYVDFMAMRRTSTVEVPWSGDKIPLRTIFFIYMVFLVAVAARYLWRITDILRNGPPPPAYEALDRAEAEARAARLAKADAP